jgi:ABC-type multidrug transport system fused ATPase/permease subunit
MNTKYYSQIYHKKIRFVPASAELSSESPYINLNLITMSNSFYYFFSATPQVLASVMALFGVFVFFRIQGLKKELFFFGDQASQRVAGNKKGNEGAFKNSEEEQLEHSSIQSILSESVEGKDIYRLNDALRRYERQFDYGDKLYMRYARAFSKLYYTLEKIINRTIISSVVTSILIVLCLLIIPFDKLLLCHNVLIMCLFIGTGIGIIVVFVLLINILCISIKEKHITNN